MREHGHGGIINVASAAGFAAGPRMAAYNVSKAGVMSLSETLATELAGSGLRVTVLCPTFVKTNIFTGPLIESGAADAAAGIAKYVGMSPDKVARTTLDAHDKGRLYVVPPTRRQGHLAVQAFRPVDARARRRAPRPTRPVHR